jgi:predicted nucleic acid-binding protein
MIVADTNLIAYLLVPGEANEDAEMVLRLDPEWAAPVLWRSELRNVLVSYLRRDLLTLPGALAVMEEAESLLEGREYALPTRAVLALAAGSSCSAYDCEFIALAQQLAVRMVTSDRGVLRAFPEVAVTPRGFAAR